MAKHLPPSSTTVKNGCRYTYNPPCMPSCHVQGQLCFYLQQTEGQFYFTHKYSITTDKSKLSEPVKGKVMSPKSNQISELIWSLTVMSQRGTLQLWSRRRKTVRKLNLSHSYNMCIHPSTMLIQSALENDYA